MQGLQLQDFIGLKQRQMISKSSDTDIVNKQIQIVPNRLYFYSTNKKYVKPNDSIFDFNVDDSLSYVPFHNDFGPLKISCVFQYVSQLHLIHQEQQNSHKQFWHITSSDPKKYTNSIFLICAYTMLILNKTPTQAFEPFQKFKIIGFRDSSLGNSAFEIKILDCLKGLHRATTLGWFDMKSFSVDEYQYYEKIQNGDLNQIVKDKIYSFSLPASDNKDKFGKKQATPVELAQTFKKLGISVVIHLSQAEELAKALQNEKIKDYHLPFPDFTFPESELIEKFNAIMAKHPEDSKFAITCKTGLGKVGTMIGCYVIKEYQFSGVEYIAWVRLCRPGSVVGPQQQFLVDFDKRVNKQGRSSEISKSAQKKKFNLVRRNSHNNYTPPQEERQNPKLMRSERIVRKSETLKEQMPQITQEVTVIKRGVKKPKVGFNVDEFLDSFVGKKR